MASLSLGIVGLPNVGKSTLFNALTRQKALAANYPFATIDPNTGIVAVPDERLDQLAELYKPERVVAANVTFIDIAGLVAGAHKGEGLGNKFLAHIRETSAICQVVRAFHDDNITHVMDNPHPKSDMETIETELVLADLETAESQIARLEKQAKGDKTLLETVAVLKNAQTILDNGTMLSKSTLDLEQLSGLGLMTVKPLLYVFNVDEETLLDEARQQELLKLVAPIPAVTICAKLEAELGELEPAEAHELLAEYGQTRSGLEQLIRLGYDVLGLQTYFTAGPKEVRAWTIKKGERAPEAAGVIHTDFQRGFIAAEVSSFDELISAGGWAAAKAEGKVRTEGKTYVMRDGDVVEFRFNV